MDTPAATPSRLGGLEPRRVLDALDEGVLVQSPAGRVLAVNAAASRILARPDQLVPGADRSALEGPLVRSDGTALPPDEMPGRRAVRTGEPQLGIVLGIPAGGGIRWVEVNSRPIIEADAVVAVVSSVRDVTDRRAMELALRDSERRQRLLLEHAVGGYVIIDERGRAVDWSGTLLTSPDRPVDDLVVSDLESVHPDDRDAAERLIQAARARPGQHRGELRTRGADGQELWVEITATDHGDDESIGGVVVNFSDITERKRAELALAHEAAHDVVTGLPNRRQLTALLDAALAERELTGERIGVIFFDVDQFKVVNDSIGHPAGDEILVQVGGRLRDGVGPDSTVSRFGGDEFVVMCTGVTTIDDVAAIADGLMALFEVPLTVDGSDRIVTLSGGVAIAPGGASSADLLREADTALNLAKERGRARVEVFSDDVRDRTTRRLTLERDLGRALVRGQLRLVYQPIVDLHDGRPVGCEALLRWDHAELGPVAPAEFIPLAEKTGLIGPIGDWVVARSVDQLRRWSDAGAVAPDFSVAVNVSAVQLADPTFIESVTRTIGDARIDPRQLHLEITESVLMEDVRRSIAQLEELRALGVRIDVDDFGTGHSSLAYLKRLPITTLKIDRSFVAGLGSDPHDTSIVRAIISLGQALDLDLVAEGVETVTQLHELRRLGCRRAQGYLWLPPRPPDDVIAWSTTTSPEPAPRRPPGPS